MKKRLKVAGFWLVFCLVLGTGLFVQEQSAAASSLSEKPTIGTPGQDNRTGHGSTLQSSYGVKSTQYLMSGSSLINALSSTRIYVQASTKAFQPVDKISVNLFLEEWDSDRSQWVTVLPIGTTANMFSSVVSTSKEVTAKKDKYYRLRVIHRVLNGSVVEEKTSISTYIYTS